MTLPHLALALVFGIIGIVVLGSIIMIIINVRRELAERKQHFHDLAWPFRVVETMDGKYRVQKYACNNKFYEWKEANVFDNPGDAKRYCIEHTAIVIKNRYGKMTMEDMEEMHKVNRMVKQVVPIDNIVGKVCSFMQDSETLPDLAAKDIDYLTSRDYITAHCNLKD